MQQLRMTLLSHYQQKMISSFLLLSSSKSSSSMISAFQLGREGPSKHISTSTPSTKQRSPSVTEFRHFTSISNGKNSNNNDDIISTTKFGKYPDESMCQNFPINVIDTMRGKADWNNRIILQSKWNNKEKGWQVQVEWKMSTYGIGLFALEDITKDTILRIGKNGYNLMQFSSVQDIENFCRPKTTVANDKKTDNDDDDEEYIARLNYVKDYLWGYSPFNTDYNGYDLVSLEDEDGNNNNNNNNYNERFFGMWIPGNGLNHHPEPNTVYRTRQGGTDEGIVLMSLRNISAGEELFDDYRRHGKATQWLLDFAKDKKVTLNFADCNDFVGRDNNKRV